MGTTIKIKRGYKSSLPTLAVGEVAWCFDTKELFIGTNSGNELINKDSELHAIFPEEYPHEITIEGSNYVSELIPIEEITKVESGEGGNTAIALKLNSIANMFLTSIQFYDEEEELLETKSTSFLTGVGENLEINITYLNIDAIITSGETPENWKYAKFIFAAASPPPYDITNFRVDISLLNNELPLEYKKVLVNEYGLVVGGTTELEEYSKGVIETNESANIQFWTGTQAEYDALTPDPNTIYLIEE